MDPITEVSTKLLVFSRTQSAKIAAATIVAGQTKFIG